MGRALRRAALLCALLVVSACGALGGSAGSPGPASYPGWPPGTSYELIPIPASTEIVVGQNRFLLGLIDQENRSVVAAGLPVQMRFYDLAVDPATPASTAAG